MGKISDNIKVDYSVNNDGLGVTLQALFKGMEGLVQSKTVVGEPVQFGDTTLVPLMEVSAGLASGALKNNAKNNGAGAMSTKMAPVAILILQGDRVRLVNVKNQDVFTRLLDLIPEAIDKIARGAVTPEAKKTAEDMLAKSASQDDAFAADDLMDEIEIINSEEN